MTNSEDDHLLAIGVVPRNIATIAKTHRPITKFGREPVDQLAGFWMTSQQLDALSNCLYRTTRGRRILGSKEQA